MQPIKNNSSLLKTILGLYMFLIIVSTVNDFLTLHILNNFGNGIIPDYVDQFDDYTTVFNMLFLVILISVFIISGIWLYRSHKRLRFWGVENLKFSDGSCVWWYFVPFMALFKPYQSMRETWFASQKPSDWSLSSSPMLLKIWWGLWIFSNMVDSVYARLSFKVDSEDLNALAFLTNFSIFSNIFDFLSALMFFLVVKQVNEMQMAYQNSIQATQ